MSGMPFHSKSLEELYDSRLMRTATGNEKSVRDVADEVASAAYLEWQKYAARSVKKAQVY